MRRGCGTIIGMFVTLGAGLMLGSHGTYIMMSSEVPSVRLEVSRSGDQGSVATIVSEIHGSSVRKTYTDSDGDGRYDSFTHSSVNNYRNTSTVSAYDRDRDGAVDQVFVRTDEGHECNYQTKIFDLNSLDLVRRCERETR